LDLEHPRLLRDRAKIHPHLCVDVHYPEVDGRAKLNLVLEGFDQCNRLAAPYPKFISEQLLMLREFLLVPNPLKKCFDPFIVVVREEQLGVVVELREDKLGEVILRPVAHAQIADPVDRLREKFVVSTEQSLQVQDRTHCIIKLVRPDLETLRAFSEWRINPLFLDGYLPAFYFYS
jgi:hypothetical protein